MRDQFNAFTKGYVDGMALMGEWIWTHWPLVLFALLALVLFLEGR